MTVKVIGGGLAGCEAAWQIAGYVFPAAAIGIVWVSTQLYNRRKKREMGVKNEI